MFIQILSYTGIVTGFILLVSAIALGLYYISELVEEHTEPTKRVLRKLIYIEIAMLTLLWLFDSFPFKLTMFLIFSHVVYFQNLVKFPYVQLTSPVFIFSCVLVVANHFLWFSHFHNPDIPPLSERLRPDYVPPRIPLFSEVCSFFGLCVWLIPFALFVSLSAHDNLLPHHMETATDGQGKKKKTGLAKWVVEKLRDYVYASSRFLGYELDPNYGTII
ncbi:DUF396-domain-containing protein [Metschnikowia bicuspidata var. bicuspidata NRRL YB-4993]|uniref:DUF396-domain-containing protein n=1 Tax=Metschnikowia bicuspidata var. bicuspidata NRRL YB-4993 TaxID=869754 RepID=A0A1A0H7R9_9ASCO|nr:DUF396-domain-containing protein [Metschnikowia bicuspidata var. bicuspidata NRRL YB-4993]OBA20144.1 DUF396-domain-containing protein [Metschnikowia bicuspidata var. bicuspidata NRRL YB-4993]